MVASESAAVLHAWPTPGAHQIDSFCKPVIRRTGARKETLVREATSALSTSNTPARNNAIPAISTQVIQQFIR
jgi:hypothetical protein